MRLLTVVEAAQLGEVRVGVLPPRHHEDGGVCRGGHGLLLDVLHIRVTVLDGVRCAQLLYSISIPEGYVRQL